MLKSLVLVGVGARGGDEIVRAAGVRGAEVRLNAPWRTAREGGADVHVCGRVGKRGREARAWKRLEQHAAATNVQTLD